MDSVQRDERRTLPVSGEQPGASVAWEEPTAREQGQLERWKALSAKVIADGGRCSDCGWRLVFQLR